MNPLLFPCQSIIWHCDFWISTTCSCVPDTSVSKMRTVVLKTPNTWTFIWAHNKVGLHIILNYKSKKIQENIDYWLTGVCMCKHFCFQVKCVFPWDAAGRFKKSYILRFEFKRFQCQGIRCQVDELSKTSRIVLISFKNSIMYGP